MSNLYPEIHEALREAGLLKEKTKLPKFGTVLDPQRKGYKTAAEKKNKRGERIKELHTYIHEKFADSWQKVPLHAIANNLCSRSKLVSTVEQVLWRDDPLETSIFSVRP